MNALPHRGTSAMPVSVDDLTPESLFKRLYQKFIFLIFSCMCPRVGCGMPNLARVQARRDLENPQLGHIPQLRVSRAVVPATSATRSQRAAAALFCNVLPCYAMLPALAGGTHEARSGSLLELVNTLRQAEQLHAQRSAAQLAPAVLVNHADAAGWTPLMHAIRMGAAQAAKVLIDNGASITPTAQFWEWGARPGTLGCPSATLGEWARTWPLEAAASGKPSAPRRCRLIETTAVHEAADARYECLKHVLQPGVDVNVACAPDGYTPLHVALTSPSPDQLYVMRLLFPALKAPAPHTHFH